MQILYFVGEEMMRQKSMKPSENGSDMLVNSRAIFPDAAILALSATCTNRIKKHVSKVLNLRQEHTKFISVSPNKTNIKLVVNKIDNATETAMYWLIDSLEHMKVDFPKTLIYANSISGVSKLYSYVVSELVECAKHVEMFHSETPEVKKKIIITSLSQSDSDIRVVFATTALGMGIDVSNCHSIVLYWPPRSVRFNPRNWKSRRRR